MGPLRGEYGFLTQFDGLTDAEARARVRTMMEVYGILEFQFYNAFEGYSKPPEPGKQRWRCAAMGTPVRLSIIRAYADEIMQLGGRSWLYLQTMGTDPGDKETQRGVRVRGQYTVHGKALIDVVVPNAMWARRIAPRWAKWAASLGFSGIHWDTLGNINGLGHAGCDLPGFLHAALPLLHKQDLAQTCNFVDGFGWSRSLLGDVVAFPYWDSGAAPQEEGHFFKMLSYWDAGAVLVEFPKKMKKAIGIWSLDTIIKRWQKVRCHGGSYLCIGDGNRRIHSDYLLDALNMSGAEIAKVHNFLAAENNCPGSTDKHGECVNSGEWRQENLILSVRPSTDSVVPVLRAVSAHKLLIGHVIVDTFDLCSARVLDVRCHGVCPKGRRLQASGHEPVIEMELPFEEKGRRNEAPGSRPSSLTEALQDAFDRAGVGLTVVDASVQLATTTTHTSTSTATSTTTTSTTSSTTSTSTSTSTRGNGTVTVAAEPPVPARFSVVAAAGFWALALPLGVHSLIRGRRAGSDMGSPRLVAQVGDDS